MAKDPAFLFYYQDFAYGTRKMSFEEKGAYIELLCEQADTGHLSLDDIKRSLNSHFSIWERICKKFKQDEEGRFYNSVLEEHISKRKSFVNSRKKNLMGSHKEAHMNSHMENVNVNVNVNRKDKRFRKPTLEQITKYCKETKSSVDPEVFFNNYESTDWIKANGQKVKNWKATVKTWEKREKPGSDKQQGVSGRSAPGTNETNAYLESLK